MGLSKSKSKTESTPYAAAVPAINSGLAQAQEVNTANQPRLQSIADTLGSAFQSMAPSAFGSNSFIDGAENAASSIGGGKYVGTNPGASVYSSLMAGSKGPGSYDGIGANNPGLPLLQSMATQQGGAPTDQFYADTLGGKYLTGNPYLDGIVKSSNDDATKAINARFAASGMGEGVSTPYAGVLSDALSKNENTLRYGAYNDELSRMGQIAGQSDSMTNATKDRSLTAATSLGSLYDQNGQLRLGAEQAKDAQFNTDRSSQLAGATAADSNYNAQISQVLQALGMAPELNSAQYAGVAPMLSLAGSAAAIPYAGTSEFANIVNSLAGQYGTKETTTKGSIMDYLMQMQSNAAKASAGA